MSETKFHTHTEPQADGKIYTYQKLVGEKMFPTNAGEKIRALFALNPVSARLAVLRIVKQELLRYAYTS
jgi:hypothetical protein